jgi:hypothetical protein
MPRTVPAPGGHVAGPDDLLIQSAEQADRDDQRPTGVGASRDGQEPHAGALRSQRHPLLSRQHLQHLVRLDTPQRRQRFGQPLIPHATSV